MLKLQNMSHYVHLSLYTHTHTHTHTHDFTYVCVGVYMGLCPWKPDEGVVGIPELVLQALVSHLMWEQNGGPLEEHRVFLTTVFSPVLSLSLKYRFFHVLLHVPPALYQLNHHPSPNK